MKELEVKHCRVLVAVADTGGVAAAARALGYSQSTISETLLALERLVELPILVRRPGRGARLTSTAEQLLPYARRMISASEAALSSISPRHRQTIKLGAIESASSYLLPRAIAALRQQSRAVDFQVTTGVCHVLRSLVETGDLDAAITLEPRRSVSHGLGGQTTTLGKARLAFIAREPIAANVTKDLLATRTILIPESEGAVKELVDAWFASTGRDVRLESAGSVDGVKRGVQTADAIGVLPAYSIGDEVSSGTVSELKLADDFPAVGLELTTQGYVRRNATFCRLAHLVENEIARVV